ncbi:peroxiredoxin [Beggiatoa leptomitoformis]|uniref:thioredoxin-dependent peroxiredoxin n=1 Tax=Beggiatoa leptomitoformis TaxID=288004 RepID=A0A2N9YFU6_9GAMM|nr:peroxiredoxin [Beggiatoa leptomitoformis]ALG68260.1 redoxin domain-containing protein [Beggiatoa leptomitoformis]AUI69431.1 redoxin domain-containing protein [Beggiatoa leptomitoformis]
MPLVIGESLPPVSLPATGDKTIHLPDCRGQVLVLYFYPRDDTPGCTQEGQDFRDHFAAFQAKNALILGVSRDSVKKHEKFKSKYEFPFDLLADEEETLCNVFDIVKPKNMYGKQVRGIERSTFIFDKEGILRYEWRKVKVPDHVQTVLAALDKLA